MATKDNFSISGQKAANGYIVTFDGKKVLLADEKSTDPLVVIPKAQQIIDTLPVEAPETPASTTETGA